jgi:Spy/CpxP family protein refolding chaperone
MRASIIGITAFLACLPSMAQHQPSGYAGMQSREIKALSSEQIADLRDGKGMGASLPAELNGVPGPLHVLQLKDRLKVTAEQQATLERITDEMKASAQSLGEAVIRAERELDQSFKAGTADEGAIRDASIRIGELNGQLRAVHLVAHLKTKQVLSNEQVVAYNDARGYSSPTESHRHRH